MSDEEYDDELPPITVNSSTRESNTMRMPSAEELARERAREAECERELRLLRAADADPALAAADSSGSEGEVALAAAVSKLQMHAASRARPLDLEALLLPLLARLPHAGSLADHVHHVHEREALTNAMCEAAVSPGLPAGGAVACAAWLCCAGVAAPARDQRRRSRRALHYILSSPPFDDVDSEDSRTLKAAILDGIGDAGARVEVADALAPARALPLADCLHRSLLAAALADLLNCDLAPSDGSCLCAWAAGSVAAAGRAGLGGQGGLWLRVVSRVVRTCRAGAAACVTSRARLLAALPAPQPGDARAQPDRLEVLVGASKLQLLLRE